MRVQIDYNNPSPPDNSSTLKRLFGVRNVTVSVDPGEQEMPQASLPPETAHALGGIGGGGLIGWALKYGPTIIAAFKGFKDLIGSGSDGGGIFQAPKPGEYANQSKPGEHAHQPKSSQSAQPSGPGGRAAGQPKAGARPQAGGPKREGGISPAIHQPADEEHPQPEHGNQPKQFADPREGNARQQYKTTGTNPAGGVGQPLQAGEAPEKEPERDDK